MSNKVLVVADIVPDVLARNTFNNWLVNKDLKWAVEQRLCERIDFQNKKINRKALVIPLKNIKIIKKRLGEYIEKSAKKRCGWSKSALYKIYLKLSQIRKNSNEEGKNMLQLCDN